jgi:hypothetical protein
MLLIADDVMVTMRVKADRGYQSDEGAEPKLIFIALAGFFASTDSSVLFASGCIHRLSFRSTRP